MSNRNKISRICVVDTVHGLLHYLLLSSYEEIKETFFFFGNGIDVSFKNKFGKHFTTIAPDSHGFLRKRIARIPVVRNLVDKIEYFYRHCIYYPLKWPFILSNRIEYWGMCHHNFSAHVLRNHDYYHVEDGMLNYIDYPFNPPLSRFKWVWKWIFGNDYNTQRTFSGSESRCKKVYLTGMMRIANKDLLNKAEINSLEVLWERKDICSKRLINHIFGIDEYAINTLSQYDTLLLLQPFSIDGLLEEHEEYDMYKWIISHIECDKLVLKPHPRDKRNFAEIYKNVIVFDTKAPMELLALNGVVFKNVYTVSSSAALALPYPIHLGFIGNRVCKTLYNKDPQCTQENFKTDNPNVTMIKFPNRY